MALSQGDKRAPPTPYGLLGLAAGDHCGAEGPSRRLAEEAREAVEEQPADVGEEVPVVAEEQTQDLRNRPDELPVGQGKQQVLIEVLGEQEGPLLTAGRTQVNPSARNRAEVFQAASRVRASDAGHALQVVVEAREKACCNAGDPLDVEVAEFLRVARIVVRREMPEMIVGHMLQSVGAPLGIGRPR